MAIRLAHFSDVHLTSKPLGWHPRDWISKRATGWVNVRLLGRGRRFKQAPAVVAAMMRALRERALDALVFSGDATGMGFESEFAVAAKALGVGDEALPPAVAVPGNHDYYTPRAVRGGLFEAYFGPWQVGLRVDDQPYPFARRVGDVWLICANSSTVNRWNWDASGAIGPDQLRRLRLLCASLSPGVRVLVTHYPVRTARGEVEPRVHRLRDHAAALEAASDCGIGLWLHGHIHRGFVLKPTGGLPFPVVCVGSSTQNNRWMYNEYTIAGTKLEGVHRVYDPDHDRFRDAGFFELDLHGG
ncbi:MAG TPA: metallophosphoesterase [Fimbriiglobus sp.]|jgi:3',5'-cyclic AMP phosphodiesterase CpdA|nr:metallophosphoesterase [Fimbriiglobus sp.]